MLGQARGQFLFSKGFKKQIYCITDCEYKVDSSSTEPSGKFFGFLDTVVMIIPAELKELKKKNVILCMLQKSILMAATEKCYINKLVSTLNLN